MAIRRRRPPLRRAARRGPGFGTRRRGGGRRPSLPPSPQAGVRFRGVLRDECHARRQRGDGCPVCGGGGGRRRRGAGSPVGALSAVLDRLRRRGCPVQVRAHVMANVGGRLRPASRAGPAPGPARRPPTQGRQEVRRLPPDPLEPVRRRPGAESLCDIGRPPRPGRALPLPRYVSGGVSPASGLFPAGRRGALRRELSERPLGPGSHQLRQSAEEHALEAALAHGLTPAPASRTPGSWTRWRPHGPWHREGRRSTPRARRS